MNISGGDQAEYSAQSPVVEPGPPKLVTCFVCEGEIDTDKHGDGMLYGAVFFTSPGNYGSRVWDSMHGSLRVYVCDECLIERAPRGFYISSRTRSEWTRFEPFNADDPTQGA